MTNISKIPLKQFSVCLKFHFPPDPSRHQPPRPPPPGTPHHLTAALLRHLLQVRPPRLHTAWPTQCGVFLDASSSCTFSHQ